jgi:serine/threonine protein kinase
VYILTHNREVLGLNKFLPNAKGYTKAVDMWALGCVTVVLLTGGSAFIDPKTGQYSEKLASECSLEQLNNDPDWKFVNKRSKNFVYRLIVLDEAERMTAKQALQHHWFTNEICKKSFEMNYESAIKDWKPTMTFGRPVVCDLDEDQERRKKRATPRPIEAHYQPYHRNVGEMLHHPKRPRCKSVEEYLKRYSSSPDPVQSSTITQKSPPPPRQASAGKPFTGSSLGSEFIHDAAVFNLLTPRKASLALSQAADCETPLPSIEVPPSKPSKLNRPAPLRGWNTINKPWPYSPGAWDSASDGKERDQANTKRKRQASIFDLCEDNEEE